MHLNAMLKMTATDKTPVVYALPFVAQLLVVQH